MPEAKNYPNDKKFIGPFDDFNDTFSTKTRFGHMSNLKQQQKV